MPVEFPEGLRGMINAGKTRSIGASFVEDQPVIGPSYIESVTDDQPEFYDFSLILTKFEAGVFWAWFNLANYCDKGRQPFTMPVKLDSGDVVDQTVRFIEGGVPQLTADNGLTKVYTCRVRLDNRVEAYNLEDLMEFYELYGNNPEELSALDLTINVEWPNA